MNSSNRRILVVDDEVALREVVEAMLQMDGHYVEGAANGREALSRLESSAFDLVITDFNMPFMKGDELAATVRQRQPDTRIIMITGCADMVDSTIDEKPCESVLLKPFSLESLRQTLKAVLVS